MTFNSFQSASDYGKTLPVGDFSWRGPLSRSYQPPTDPNTQHQLQNTPPPIPGVDLKEKEQGKFNKGVAEGKWDIVVYFLVTQNFSFFKAGR